MEINSNRSLDPAATPAAGPVKAKGAAQAGSLYNDDTSFESSANLASALSNAPDSRADVIARAEKLVADPSYPPPETIRRIANLLAANLINGN